MKDPQIRQLLLQTELKHHALEEDTKIVHEMKLSIAKARIDMAVINGHLHGYEIKSASDNLQRLPKQIEAYTKVFDYLTVVTEDKYYKKIQGLLPEWVSINVCSDDKTIQNAHVGGYNNQKDGFYIAKLLRRDELINVLEQLGIVFYKGYRTWTLCEVMAHNLTAVEISDIVRNKLKMRIDWKANSAYHEAL